MIILLHTSKTMRPPAEDAAPTQEPTLMGKSSELATYLKTLSVKQLTTAMKISPKLAGVTHDLIRGWSDDSRYQRVAIDSFLGDIYSGLQVPGWSESDRDYANEHLRILSGLYGILRPLDGIYPYRLEMGYRLPDKRFANLYGYWGDAVAKTLPKNVPIINLAALEYSKVVTDHLTDVRVIAPSFLTVSPTTNEPTFVVVHAKIARGAFARWMIKQQISDTEQLTEFHDLDYRYDSNLSTPDMPVFVCKTFGGLGLSVRLS